MNELYNPFKNDIASYCYQSSLSTDDIEQRIQKYSKDTFVKTMDDSAYDIRNPRALFCMEMEKSEDENGVCIDTVSKTIFLNFPKNISEIPKFLAEVVHEMTHAFQQEAEDRFSIKELIEIYYENSDKDEISDTLKIMDIMFIEFENIFRNAYGSQTDLKEFIQVALATMLMNTKQKINYSMLLDYFVLRARNEEEAYINMLEFIPNSTAEENVQMYDDLASYLNEIATEYRKSKKNC